MFSGGLSGDEANNDQLVTHGTLALALAGFATNSQLAQTETNLQQAVAEQGVTAASLESLDADDYETLTIYSVYQYLSTILAFIIGFSYIFYHSLKEYKVQKKLISETVELSQSKTG